MENNLRIVNETEIATTIKIFTKKYYKQFEFEKKPMKECELKTIESIVSKCSQVLKVFKRLTHIQINGYVEIFFSKLKSGLRKLYGTQYFLVIMFQKWKNTLDKK